MSYNSLATQVQDTAFRERVIAAVNKEAFNNPTLSDTEYGQQIQNGLSPLTVMLWPTATATEAQYASALAANNPNPGGDESVITDPDILAAVQVNWPEDTP